MSSKTIYTCDKCKATSEKNGLWQVNINTSPVEMGKRSAFVRDAKHSAEWCRECMEKAHLLPNVRVPKEDLPKCPTFDDLLQEIIENVVDIELDRRL